MIALVLGGFVATRPVSAQTKNVNIIDFDYSPKSITINVGDSITWTNTGSFSHSATSDTAGLFDTTVLAPTHVSSAITFNTPGTFTYHCLVHGTFMTGTVVVVDPNASPSPSPSANPSPSPGTPQFCDVTPSTLYYDAIIDLASRGIIRGFDNPNGPGKCFGPDEHTLRAQMAALIARANGWDLEDHGNSFPDQCDPTGPYDPNKNCIDPALWLNVGTLNFHNVAHGVQDGTYNPRGNVLYVQVISFITRGMVQKGLWQQETVDDMTIYPNVTADSGHRLDLVTYVKHVGALPGAPLTTSGGAPANWADWDKEAPRNWFAQVLFLALQHAGN
jgi:plastocyanin